MLLNNLGHHTSLIIVNLIPLGIIHIDSHCIFITEGKHIQHKGEIPP